MSAMTEREEKMRMALCHAKGFMEGTAKLDELNGYPASAKFARESAAKIQAVLDETFEGFLAEVTKGDAP